MAISSTFLIGSELNGDIVPICLGCYFGSYFIMGGERFDTNQQDTYLFGENEDLNFLGNKPVPVSVKFIWCNSVVLLGQNPITV